MAADMGTLSRCRGLNVFEFIALLMISGGLGYGLMRGLETGWWGALVGAVLGAGAAWLAWVVLMLCILVPFWLFLTFYRPFYPRCRNGTCRDKDYKILTTELAQAAQLRAEGQAKQGMLVQCRCGTLYVEATFEKRFFEVTPEGTLRPYLRYRPFGRWQPDPG
jgi:hypothetical protein